MNLKDWQAAQVKQDQHKEKHAHTDSSKREWITVDGEGWGRDELGRQHYRFMIAANESGFQMKVTPQHRESLTMDEALTFLTSIVPNYRQWCKQTGKEWYQPLIGGFALGYDYAHILIDISEQQLSAILSSGSYDTPPTKLTDRLGGKLTAGNFRIYANDRWSARVPLELVSVYDTFKYYQAAFLKVMKAYATPEQWTIIEEGKNRRSIDSDHDINAEMVYCLTECRVHSRAMNDLSRAIHELGLSPRGWFGPGSLAQSALVKHHIKSRYWKPDSEQPDGLASAALHAYIGGRFETTGHGWLPRMYAYDIRSAYPAAMIKLPCLKHGRWRHVKGHDAEMAMQSERIAVGYCEWHCDNPPGGWGPYPTRSVRMAADRSGGSLAGKLPAWPFDGRAWLWSEEYRAGQFLVSSSVSPSVTEAWVYEQWCDCEPFSWVPEYYELKRSLAAEGNEIGSKVIKLLVNSLYGKIAQTVGNPPVPTWIWAGLITQSARAQLLSAIELNPSAVVMVATDAVYSTVPLSVNLGDGLGQWDGPEEHGRTLVIQAGFWKDYDTGSQKTRGIARKYLEGDEDHPALWPVFETLWNDIVGKNRDIRFAVVPVRYSDHIGLNRARQYGIEKLGRWTDDAYQDVRFRVDKRPHLIGQSIDGWWKSAPTRTDRVGEQLELEVTVGDQYLAEGRSLVDQYFIVEQPDAAEWGYDD